MKPCIHVEKNLHEWFIIRRNELERMREYIKTADCPVDCRPKVINRIRVVDLQLQRAAASMSIRELYVDSEPDVLTVGTFNSK